jgi:hypothetical protein
MWGDADTAIGGNRDRFPSTQVSLIEAAAGEPLAMERVLAFYWKPVYKFIRFKFHKDNEAAKELTQGFFASALERDFFQRFDPYSAGSLTSGRDPWTWRKSCRDTTPPSPWRRGRGRGRSV